MTYYPEYRRFDNFEDLDDRDLAIVARTFFKLYVHLSRLRDRRPAPPKHDNQRPSRRRQREGSRP